MKRAGVLGAAVAAMLLLASTHLAGQDEQARSARFFFGPCVGVGSVIISGDTFNSNMQSIYPSADRYYYPVFTLMGVQADQIVPLGNSKSSLAFHEIFLIGGLDQSIPMPTLDVLFGYYGAGGFEIGLGPHFAVMAPNGTVKLAAAAVYSIGWWLPLGGVRVPIKVAFIPLPSYANPQLSLLVGFVFEATE